MMWHYFIGSSKIKTVDSAYQRTLNSHQTLFLVRGWGGWKMAVLAGSCNDVELSAVEAVTVVKSLCGSCTYCDVAVVSRFGYRVILSSEYHTFMHPYTCMHKSWLLKSHTHTHTQDPAVS